MQCYDCEHNMKTDVQTIRTGVHASEAPKGLHTVRVCLMFPDIFAKLGQNLPQNFAPDKVSGTQDMLIKHCTKYKQRPLVDGTCTIQPENLAQEIGNTYVDDQKSPTDQWTRVLGLLNKNGFTIVRREVDK